MSTSLPQAVLNMQINLCIQDPQFDISIHIILMPRHCSTSPELSFFVFFPQL